MTSAESQGPERDGAQIGFPLEDAISLLGASSESANSAETYEKTLRQVVEITGMTGMTYIARTDSGYFPTSWVGLSDSLFRTIEQHPREFTEMFKPLESKTDPIVFVDLNNHPYFPPIFKGLADYFDVVWVPVRHADVLLGFLCMAKRESGGWPDKDIAYFSAIGKLCGAIVYRALVAERHRQQAVEAERERVEAQFRDSIIRALGISLIEEQLSAPADEAAIPKGSAARVISKELTAREQEVLREVATGASNKEIAARLYISTSTVKMTLQNILAKLNMHNRVEAAVYAVEMGLRPGRPSRNNGKLAT